MWDPTPWAVEGGAQHTAAIGRVLAYAASSGAEGIVTPEALRVRPLAVPGTSVRVAPGACLMVNRYPGGEWQTYVGRNPIEHTVAIAPTGSGGGRTDLVVARVMDPQYQGQAPANPLTFEYMRTEVIQGVPAGTTSARDLNLNYPAVALARVTLPASTGTVQAAHITDLREVAIPRTLSRVLAAQHAGPTETIRAGMTDLRTVAYRPVDVPEWATVATVSAMFSGIALDGGSQAQGFAAVQLGTIIAGIEVRIDENWSGSWHRFTLAAGGEVRIPAGIRGTTVEVPWRLRHTNGGGRFQLDAGSTFLASIEFREQAD